MNLVVREALLAFRRAPLLSALSVTTIAFSLFVVGLFGLVAINLQQRAARRRGAGRESWRTSCRAHRSRP